MEDGQDGVWTFWYENGRKISKGFWKMGMRHGLYKSYYENGYKSFEGNFEDGELIKYNCWDDLGNQKECMENQFPIF